MGATNFRTVAFGKSATEAFAAAVGHAKHEFGHGGYTGTIAEKSDFVQVELPTRVKVARLESWFLRYYDEFSPFAREDLATAIRDWEPGGFYNGTGHVRGAKGNLAKAKRALAKFDREAAKFYAEVERVWSFSEFKRIAGAYNDKWGPAVCVEVKGAQAAELKARYGYKGTRVRAFVFLGYASE